MSLRYRIGRQHFPSIIEDGCVDVDKTDLIIRKAYDLPFRNDHQKVILIGLNFSSKTRKLSDWEVK